MIDTLQIGFGVAQRKRGGPISHWWDTLRSQDRNLAPKFCCHGMSVFGGGHCSNLDVQVNMAESNWSAGM